MLQKENLIDLLLKWYTYIQTGLNISLIVRITLDHEYYIWKVEFRLLLLKQQLKKYLTLK